MGSLDETLRQRLQEIRDANLHRVLRPLDSAQGPRMVQDGHTLLNFSSNDYLGLANHPAVREAAVKAVEKYGAGSGASRLICGSLTPHHQLEEALAALKKTEAALSFSSGYATALGTIQALVGRGDIIIIDKQVHACIVDGARLSGATLRVFPHRDLERLEKHLRWAADKTAKADSSKEKPRVLVITESVFSMDGDLAPLKEMVELKNRYGAWLMLDEAHATGLFGDDQGGLAEAFELADQIEVHMGTLGKALGAAGGFIAGSQTLIDYLVNQARSFIFSTAPSPAAAAAAAQGVALVQSDEGSIRRKSLWILVDRAKRCLIDSGWILPPIQSPIIPMMVGPEQAAVDLSRQLRDAGLFIPAIRYPTVARGRARLRLTMTAAHEVAHLETLKAALQECCQGSPSTTETPEDASETTSTST